MKSIKTISLIGFLGLMLLSACGGNDSKKTEEKIAEKPGVQLYAFEVGDILVKDISLFNAGVDVGQSKQFTNTAYLIRHPKGDLIWDTGLPDALAEAAEGNDSPGFLMKMPKTLSGQLKEINYNASEVDFIAVSHLHGDHIGNMNLFSKATVVLQEEEYAGLFEGATPNPAVASLVNNPSIKLKGDHDVFGDGSVVIMRAPGHTDGHQVLFVNLPETGPVVLSGDLWHFAKNRELRGVPQFNTNADATYASMDRVEAFLKEKGATLWIQHDYDQQQGIPHAPEVIK